ncbi:hypothetical protein ANO11243_017900 [Dothideomycetidae sp. 11243]|nr:hypothetical protein ANO11243_017900 [fungal sp. No.11243]
MNRHATAGSTAMDDSEEMVAALRAHIEAAYGGQVTQITALDKGVFRIDLSSSEAQVARVFRLQRAGHISAAKSSAAVLSYLQQIGFPAERLASHNSVTKFHGGEVLTTHFVPGKIPEPSPETSRKMGELLGRLHTLEVPSEISWSGGAWHHLIAQGGSHDEILAALTVLERARTGASEDQISAIARLEAALEAVDDLTGLPTALVHPDFALVNMIESANGGLVPVDWTGSGVGPRLFSLATLLYPASMRGYEMLEAAIAGYTAHITLTKAEVSHLGKALMLRQLTIPCWEIAYRERDPVEIAEKLSSLYKRVQRAVKYTKQAIQAAETKPTTNG